MKTPVRYDVVWERFNRQSHNEYGQKFYDMQDAIKWAETFLTPGTRYEIYRLTNGAVMDERVSAQPIKFNGHKSSLFKKNAPRRHVVTQQYEDEG